MSRTVMCVLAGLVALAGASGARGPAPSEAAQPMDAAKKVQPQQVTKTFFEGKFHPAVQIVLNSDPFVMKSFPDTTPPNANIRVDLPVYPDAEPTSAVTGIGDLGISMTPDVVDGTVYYRSKASGDTILAWYTQQFKAIGYVPQGSGSTGGRGVTPSTFVEFAPAGEAQAPTKRPDITLGYTSDGPETTFKLMALYIVVPPRPADTYLPSDIVKVVATMGDQKATVTSPTWIRSVVRQINGLQVSTGGITSCPAIIGPVYPIHAAFYRPDGSKISVTFGLPCGVRGVSVNGTSVTLQGSATLDRAFAQLFKEVQQAASK